MRDTRHIGERKNVDVIYTDASDHTDAFDLFVEFSLTELCSPFPTSPARSGAISRKGIHTHLYGA